MSIIYDALKKVENSANNNPDGGKNPDNRLKHNLKLYLLYALVVCIGIVIANLFFNYVSRSNKLAKGSQKPAARLITKIKPLSTPSSSVSKQTTQAPSAPKGASDKNYVINGIFFSDGESYALINNIIVKQGDTVDGALVKRIEPNEVELDTGGKPIILHCR